jgi:hypothetical protein
MLKLREINNKEEKHEKIPMALSYFSIIHPDEL